ncbi:MAG: DUF4340 domain-containing protein [Opitutae bacterium]|nr:DUF4340 domain-containing protein [Opitutae bacterium]MCD8298307.1 DUF4340 domain-containing protein [Opitutae bacterium]
MRFKLTIFLLLANVAAFGLIIYETTKSAARPEFEQSIFSAGISQISISAPATGESFTLEERGKSWVVSQPFEWQANSFAVRQMISELRFLGADGGFSVGEAKAHGSTLADYGLETPSLIVSVTDDAGVRELKFGKATPDGNGVYALSPDGKRIIPAAKSLFLSVSKKPEDFRVSEIFSCRPYEVESIVVRAMFKGGSEQRIGLVRAWRESEFAGEKSERIWRFETPISADAETRLVEAKLGELTSMRYKNFAKGDFALLEKAGLKSPRMRFTLEGSKVTETLLVGNANPDDQSQLFAKLESNDAIFTVPADAINSWRTVPTDLRDARFLNFDPVFLHSITIHGEKNSLTLLRTNFADETATAVKDADLGQVALDGADKSSAAAGEDSGANLGIVSAPAKIPSPDDSIYGSWQMPVAPGSLVTQAMAVDPDVICRLIEKLRDLRATKYPESEGDKKLSLEQRVLRGAFVSDFVSDEDAASMNFNVPVRIVELEFRSAPAVRQPAQTGGSTASTDDSTAVASRVVTLTIAPPAEPDSPYHAKVGNSVYSIEAGILDELSIEPSFFRERTVYKMPEGAAVLSLSLTDISKGLESNVFSATRSAASSEWEIFGRDFDESTLPEASEVEALAKVCEMIRAEAFINKPFARNFEFDYLDSGAPETWRYRLVFSVKLPGSDIPETHTLFLTKRLGGTFQLAGSVDQKCVFKISQKFIDAIHALTFAKDSSKDVPSIPVPESLTGN